MPAFVDEDTNTAVIPPHNVLLSWDLDGVIFDLVGPTCLEMTRRLMLRPPLHPDMIDNYDMPTVIHKHEPGVPLEVLNRACKKLWFNDMAFVRSYPPYYRIWAAALHAKQCGVRMVYTTGRSNGSADLVRTTNEYLMHLQLPGDVEHVGHVDKGAPYKTKVQILRTHLALLQEQHIVYHIEDQLEAVLEIAAVEFEHPVSILLVDRPYNQQAKLPSRVRRLSEQALALLLHNIAAVHSPTAPHLTR
jgi:hypothetical protein